ncbi:hypothetical protein EC957_004074 [Mortierella hygrophila]|uniref:Uncharacterized protein n=1 Tax=Mortierella hygrophila TaxID=979708 RepID=A0A9P6FIC7_9FUNG|nr:hypothetical protein EC957_004074 [Mortierella hygrophila]
MTTKRSQRSVSAGMKSDQKPFYDAGIPNPIILQMNYAQAIKRSPREVAAARAAAASASSFTTVSSITTATTTNATTKGKGAARVPLHPIWTAPRGRSDSCMSDASDAGSTMSSPSSSVSNSSNDSINQLPLQLQQQRTMTVRDSSPSPSMSSSSANERSLGKDN